MALFLIFFSFHFSFFFLLLLCFYGQFLSDKDPGESIVRPSSRGPSYLILTIKVSDGVYSHKEITEGDKDHKDITSLLRLGKKLTIGDDTFEDLDEVRCLCGLSSSGRSTQPHPRARSVVARTSFIIVMLRADR